MGKRNTPWLIASVPVVIFAGYLALTAGTVALLPKNWGSLRIGLSRPEAMLAVPDMQVEIQFDPALEDLNVTSTVIGLREWTLVVAYEEGRISSLERRVVDPHDRWWIRLRSVLGR